MAGLLDQTERTRRQAQLGPAQVLLAGLPWTDGGSIPSLCCPLQEGQGLKPVLFLALRPVPAWYKAWTTEVP